MTKKKIEWHKDLTEEQIDELKAEYIEPGDPEYDRYLADHGIKNSKEEQENVPDAKDEVVQEQPEVKQHAEENEPIIGGYNDNIVNNNNMYSYTNNDRQQEEQIQIKEAKPEYHKDLTEEQIDELKAECIEPGSDEYSQYLAQHGIKENSEKEKEQLEEEIKEELETALTDPQKENKIKLFFRKFKEKIQTIANKVRGKEAPEQEIIDALEEQGIDEGTEFRRQCKGDTRDIEIVEDLREIMESEQKREARESRTQEQVIGAI